MATVTHLNAERVLTSSAFSHAVVVTGDGRTVYVGGQNGVGPEGTIAFTELWERRGERPAVTVAVVQALANPQFEIEIDAVAVADREG
jgi:enamine deaminase RidA (YjgF/YER057c/UK114 family)